MHNDIMKQIEELNTYLTGARDMECSSGAVLVLTNALSMIDKISSNLKSEKKDEYENMRGKSIPINKNPYEN